MSGDNDLAKIRLLRYLVTVHSYIYYGLSDNVVSDAQWDRWAGALRRLQDGNDEPAIGYYDDEFWGFDGSTGCDLSKDYTIMLNASELIRIHGGGPESLYDEFIT